MTKWAFGDNIQFCHFLRGPCMFFHVLNFVKNAQLCHFVRGPWIFSLLQFCQKCSIVSFCERPVYLFASSILSEMLSFIILWEDRGFFRLFNFVRNVKFSHFERGPWIFFTFSILSRIVHFVNCEKWTANYEIRISIPHVHYVL